MRIEKKALNILKEYSGYNNYILYLQKKYKNSSNFVITNSQANYVVNNEKVKPKVARKWVKLDSYFAEKLMEQKGLVKIPEKIYIEKLLTDTDKAYHLWGKINEKQNNFAFWMPKQAIIKEKKERKVEVDYSNYSHRPPLNHQKEAIEKLLANDKYILADDMGLGKGLPIGTEIYTPSGNKKIEDLKIGSYVMGSQGKPVKVKGIYRQGFKSIYELKFSDGNTVYCDNSHLWKIYTSEGNEFVMSSRDIANDKHIFNDKGCEVWIDNGKGMDYINPPKVPIDPYIMGLIISNGNFNASTALFRLNNNKSETILPYMDKYEITKGYENSNNTNFKIKVEENLFIDLGLNDSIRFPERKIIHEEYFRGSLNDRLELLQGILDCKPFIFIDRNDITGLRVKIKSKILSEQLCRLIISLGGAAYTVEIPKGDINLYRNLYNKPKFERFVYFSFPKEIKPFKSKVNLDKYNKLPDRKYLKRRLVSCRTLRHKKETICIKVDAKDSLFMLPNGILTHNTTSTVIASLESKAKKILVICPASLKINWKREIENYTDRKVGIIEGKKWEDGDYIIINYEILKNYHKIKDKKSKENVQSKILDYNFDLVIVDEAHNLQNIKAQRTKLSNDIIENIGKVWLLTGTPMTSRPINYYNLLNLVDSVVAQNWVSYVIRYCGGYQFYVGKGKKSKKIWSTTGSTNLNELHQRTKGDVLRRLKEEVIDLPDKIVSDRFFELNSRDYLKLMGEYVEWNNKNKEKSLSVHINKLMNVRKCLAEEKVDYTIEMAQNAIDNGKKVIIFTNFTNTLEMIYTHFGKKAVKLNGEMNKISRQHSVDEFQNNDKIKVFVGNLKAAGVGITLTKGEVVIMNDLSFVPSDHTQAEDRAYRYGQEKKVIIYYPIFENTIEKIIYDKVHKKQVNFETVMGDDIIKNSLN